jgi:antitoxin component of MazEF toxin-antitoxin module
MKAIEVYPRRKIIKLGSKSLAVVIPIDLIVEKNIKRGDTVRFVKYKNDIILRFSDKND